MRLKLWVERGYHRGPESLSDLGTQCQGFIIGNMKTPLTGGVGQAFSMWSHCFLLYSVLRNEVLSLASIRGEGN